MRDVIKPDEKTVNLKEFEHNFMVAKGAFPLTGCFNKDREATSKMLEKQLLIANKDPSKAWGYYSTTSDQSSCYVSKRYIQEVFLNSATGACDSREQQEKISSILETAFEECKNASENPTLTGWTKIL